MNGQEVYTKDQIREIFVYLDWALNREIPTQEDLGGLQMILEYFVKSIDNWKFKKLTEPYKK